ncbi:oligosaccharide flippase family protein [Nevskia sp.]|uniref:oligosaccharide flippase family protein n=1 Tax=Nevskia sp. TaxID=1929292 RepID=UPI0025DFDA10|nr:oligosaccharide flippase family protein [Nevskia sp.]
MSFRNKIGAMVASTGAGQAALIVTGVVAARGLGPEDRGHFALVTLVPPVLSQVVQFGIPIAVTYVLASDRGMGKAVRGELFRIVLMQLLLAAALTVAAVFILLPQVDKTLVVPALFMVPAVVALIIQEYTYATLQGLDRFGHVAVARLLPSLLYALMAATLWIRDQVTVTTMSAAWAAAYSLSAIIGLLIARRIGLPRADSEGTKTAGEMVRFGARSFIGTLAPMDVLRFDQILGGILLTPYSLGIYVVAQAFSALPKIVAANIGYVVYVDTANRMAENPKQVSALFMKVIRLSLLGAVPCIALVVLLPTLNLFMFGAEFEDAALSSQILVGAAWVSACRRLISEFAKGLGKPEIQTASEIAICLAAAGLAYWLCSPYGFLGLAVAVAGSQIIALLLSIGLLVGALRRDERRS